ncbi:MAG TPA: thioredoxin family protein [Saprospiraceae bacterium]|nr:thioredoxin family protein [Saprospiraceae bacterium]HMQ83288.1 thioredoxin family protein [Saprospiraceae bacterium]
MKKSTLLLGLCGLAYSVFAQTEQPFFTDYEQAKAVALAENKKILMVFAGSDWCRPCMQFKKEILDSEVFQTYAQENLVVLYLDFPARKKNRLSKEQTAHHEQLAEQYNKAGAFPKLVLLDGADHLIRNLSYTNQAAEHFIKECQEIARHP